MDGGLLQFKSLNTIYGLSHGFVLRNDKISVNCHKSEALDRLKPYHQAMVCSLGFTPDDLCFTEQIHGDFGIDLIKILQKEHPEWFTPEYHEDIQNLCKEAFEAEQDVVDWIFENGELDFLPKNVINEFLKNRFNNSLESIGIDKVFEIDQNLVAETEWFDDEIIGTKHGDFFVKRSINYSKRSQSITNDGLL